MWGVVKKWVRHLDLLFIRFINSIVNTLSKHGYRLRQRRGDGKVCPKTSFDRLGDDLTELILKYLDFEDKFRFECLNRRIQSLIYNKENRFDLDYNFISKHIIEENDYDDDYDITTYECDFNTLNVILMKLKAINTIAIDCSLPKIYAQLLIKIADHCKHLTSFHIISDPFISELEYEAVEYFGKNLGHKLRNLDITGCTPEAEKLLKLTPNLESLHIESYLLDILWSKEERLLPKLKDITIDNCEAKELNQFHRYYGQTIRSLRICLYVNKSDGSIVKESLQMLKELSKFNRLTDLEIILIHSALNPNIQMWNNQILCNAFRNMFKGMSNLKKLFFKNDYIKFHGYDGELRELIKLLSECKQLRATDVLIRLTLPKPDSWIGDEDFIKERFVKELKDNKLDKYFVSMKVLADDYYPF